MKEETCAGWCVCVCVFLNLSLMRSICRMNVIFVSVKSSNVSRMFLRCFSSKFFLVTSVKTYIQTFIHILAANQ